MKKIAIIGGGISGLSAASYMSKAGHKVDLYEKNQTLGGRARQLKKDGFTFDMGPTFYWMPDIIEKFFNDFDKKASDFYELLRLDPGYEVYFDKDDSIKVSKNIDSIYEAFEKEETGSSKFLKKFLKTAEYNYNVAIEKAVYKPGLSPLELIMPETVARTGQFFKSISGVVRKGLKSDKLAQLLEFPVLFLGAKPSKTPAFYCFMNYADIVLGTWHPKGGMYKLIEALQKLAEELEANIIPNSSISNITIVNNIAKSIEVNGKSIEYDLIISSADYNHTEQLLDKKYRNYSEKYWEKKTFAPSALMFYVAFNKKLKNVSHHTLFFDTDFKTHAEAIYDSPKWPDKPLFYASFPSITDNESAPEGKEAGIFLIPLASGIQDKPEIRKDYFNMIINRMEKLTNQTLSDSVIFIESFSLSDFVKDYNAYKGNAYGLANTLRQTAFLKPKLKNKNVKNLFYTGQLTVPGPGVPPSLISGKIVSELAIKYLKNESTF